MDVDIRKCLLNDVLNKRNLSQRQLAEITMISESQLSDYRHNRKLMGLKNAIKISSVLNCSIDDLYEWKIHRIK